MKLHVLHLTELVPTWGPIVALLNFIFSTSVSVMYNPQFNFVFQMRMLRERSACNIDTTVRQIALLTVLLSIFTLQIANIVIASNRTEIGGTCGLCGIGKTNKNVVGRPHGKNI
jgi:hypothetical protein